MKNNIITVEEKDSLSSMIKSNDEADLMLALSILESKFMDSTHDLRIDVIRFLRSMYIDNSVDKYSRWTSPIVADKRVN